MYAPCDDAELPCDSEEISTKDNLTTLKMRFLHLFFSYAHSSFSPSFRERLSEDNSQATHKNGNNNSKPSSSNKYTKRAMCCLCRCWAQLYYGAQSTMSCSRCTNMSHPHSSIDLIFFLSSIKRARNFVFIHSSRSDLSVRIYKEIKIKWKSLRWGDDEASKAIESRVLYKVGRKSLTLSDSVKKKRGLVISHGSRNLHVGNFQFSSCRSGFGFKQWILSLHRLTHPVWVWAFRLRLDTFSPLTVQKTHQTLKHIFFAHELIQSHWDDFYLLQLQRAYFKLNETSLSNFVISSAISPTSWTSVATASVC